MEEEKTVIKADILYDGKTKLENRCITVCGNRITEVSDREQAWDYRGTVTPAMIDAHSHIGMEREGEPYQESETNDHLSQFLPLNDPVDSIYFDDRAFKDSVDFGILYSCLVPGSGNLIGGKAKIIRNFARYRDEAVFKDYGYKMALGYNPMSTTEWKGDRPSTRMGLYAMLEKKFDDLLLKKSKAEVEREKKLHELTLKKEEKELSQELFDREREIVEKEYDLEFSSEEKALLEILSGEKTVKVHVHKEDDVLYLIDLVKKYRLKATAEHVCDVFHTEIFDRLAEAGIPIVYGPLGSVGYKVELKHAYYQNAALLMKSKATFGLMTDHPVIHAAHLRSSLKYFLIQGMTEEEAISLVTLKNARILGLEEDLGTIEKGKLASLVVWNKDPFHLGAFPTLVMGEGKIVNRPQPTLK